MKICLVRLLERSREYELRLPTSTEELETGANHFVKNVHRFLNSQISVVLLPWSFFNQLDNTPRENQN